MRKTSCGCHRVWALVLACGLAPGSFAVNNDGQTDILWRNHSSGANDAWAMNGATKVGEISLGSASGQDWKMVGTGDFNHDGQLDILWYHVSLGIVAIWIMNGDQFITSVHDSSLLPVVADTNWDCVATGYFDGPTDRNVDILWRHKGTGQNAIWHMNRTALCQQHGGTRIAHSRARYRLANRRHGRF